jgi:hypothetical protein
MRDLIKRITVDIEGVAEVRAYIAEVRDVASGAIDEALTPKGVITVLGSRIKAAGGDPTRGLYIVNAENVGMVKVDVDFVDNRLSRISAQAPALWALGSIMCVVAQYSTSGLLKEPRIIDYGVELIVS